MESVLKFKIHHLQAAVALVLASFQPQSEAVAFQPTIVEWVYEMGSRANRTDISDLTVALNDVAEELLSSRIELARYADSDFSGAIKVANDIRNHTIHVAGIAESFVLMLPEKTSFSRMRGILLSSRSSRPLRWSALRPETTLA